MSYDLTSLFTTVAASSASIVAILGGFIASKLISINGERNAVLLKLEEIRQLEEAREAELTKLRIEEDTIGAKNFITDNIQALLDRKSIDEAYQLDKHQGITKDVLKPYWDRALEIHADYQKSLNEMNNSTDCNEKGIPKSFAIKYAEDQFAYDIGCLIAKKLQYNQIGYPYFKAEQVHYQLPESVKERKETLKAELRESTIVKKQLIDEKKRLAKPKGMLTGLILFAGFSVSCIFVPLLLSPFSTESLTTARITKVVVLALFAVGLIGIFLYLISLLRWKESKR